MRRFALFGHPVTHSLSPAIQQAAFDKTGVDWTYEALDIAPDELFETTERLRHGSWDGANVTLPHKQDVIPLLDDLAESAALTSAVNTITRDEERLVGHNTDMPAFLHDLRAHHELRPSGAGLILGAGGAARAVAFGLASRGMDLHVISRSERPAKLIAADVHQTHSMEVSILPWEEASFAKASSDCALVVNATPVGMLPNDQETPWPHDVAFPDNAFMYDLIYTPGETRLVREARLSGLSATSGAGMLVEQGALAFELWTGLRAPRRSMRAALDRALDESPPISSDREVLNA
jgi:shikimate dehydrogenase